MVFRDFASSVKYFYMTSNPYLRGLKCDPLPKIRSHYKTTRVTTMKFHELSYHFMPEKMMKNISGRAVPWVRKWKSDVTFHGWDQIWPPAKSQDSIQNASVKHV